MIPSIFHMATTHRYQIFFIFHSNFSTITTPLRLRLGRLTSKHFQNILKYFSKLNQIFFHMIKLPCGHQFRGKSYIKYFSKFNQIFRNFGNFYGFFEILEDVPGKNPRA